MSEPDGADVFRSKTDNELRAEVTRLGEIFDAHPDAEAGVLPALFGHINEFVRRRRSQRPLREIADVEERHFTDAAAIASLLDWERLSEIQAALLTESQSPSLPAMLRWRAAIALRAISAERDQRLHGSHSEPGGAP